MTTSKFIKGALIDFLELLIIGVSVFILAWLFLAEPLEVTGESMTPTLRDKEQILAEKLTMNIGEIERGDIVVFKSPENYNLLLIKRVIALPNETFMIKDNNIYINNELYTENYLDQNEETSGEKAIEENVQIEVPENSYILLGDNRDKSKDSREFGAISKDQIIGTAVLVFYPWENLRIINNVDSLLPTSVVNKINDTRDF